MNAVTLVVSKVGRASSRFFQRRCRSNEENSEPPVVQVTDRDVGAAECTETQRPSMPLLYSCCKHWAWPAVTFRCRSHPHEVHVSIRDENGDTALHWACFGKAPLNAVEALLKACSELVSAGNHKGQLPIHVACSYRASSDVIRALLNAYPEGAGIADGSGSYAMHILCDYGCAVDSIRAVLETNGGVQSLTKQDGIFERTPLQILNGRKGFHNDFAPLRRERAKYSLDTAARCDWPRIRELVTSCEAVEFWQKAALMILAEYTGDSSNLDNRLILHGCAGIQTCPSSLLEYALLLYPESLLIQDENGWVPLHVAASRPADTVNVKDILADCPKASKVRDKEGRLPIELAVESDWSWNDGVGQLLAANPTSLEALNVDERLYPRIFARISRPPQGSSSALFESLQARPSICS